MLGTLFNDPFSFIFWSLGLVIAITVHEFAHAYIADRLGDPTPGLQGRLTLNPLSHLDPVGTIMLLFVGFGWGKPVQFDPYNLRNPRRDGALISIAGPISNFILAIVSAILISIFINFDLFGYSHTGASFVVYFIINFFKQLLITNIILGVFNLIPIHPLDGFKIVEGLLPEQNAREWHELERYGFIFLLFLLLPIGGISPMSRLIQPAITFLINLLLPMGKLI